MWTLLISCLIHSFLDKYICTEKSKTGFQNYFSNFCIVMAPKCQISRLLIRDSDWLNFIHFSGYKIRLVSWLGKREDQALISISTILKFPAMVIFFKDPWKFSGPSRMTTLLVLKGLKASFHVILHAKMAILDLQRYPWNHTNLIKNIDDISFIL